MNANGMNAEGMIARLNEKLPGQVVAGDPAALDPWIEVKPEGLHEVCRFLRDDDDLAFAMLNCVTGVDYFEPDAKKAEQTGWQPHLEVLYHLSSLKRRLRIVVRVRLPRWRNDSPGELPEIATVSDLWRTADWHEREVFDLIGVRFVGHPDPRRILCPEDWPGHPLRKDFAMPSEYHGIPTR
jgi:NADH-quinone oxidoreductase subunit C